MKKDGQKIEYHPSKQSAIDWKAWWDEVKYDRHKRQWYLEFNKRRYDAYYKMIDKNVAKLMKG